MLNIEIDEHSGFCFGVTTAIGKAEEELAHSQRLYCLGDIVHNGSECERLRGMGLETIDHEAFRSLRNAKVLLRAHGEPPETYATALANGINIIDATCPVVLQLQRRIKQVFSEPGRPQIVIYGKPGHAEVLGLVGQTDGTAIVIEGLEGAEKLDFTRDIRLFSQTTKPLEGFRQIVDYITAHIQAPHSVPTTPSADRWPIACRTSAILPCATMSLSSCVASKAATAAFSLRPAVASIPVLIL